MEIIIEKRNDRIKYSDFLGENPKNAYPIPWGRMNGTFIIRGNPYSSAGGKWYFRLPGIGRMGYGTYNPFYEFIFRGDIEVSSERDSNHFKDCYGWRAGCNKWIYLHGKVYPTRSFIFEMKLQNKFFEYIDMYWNEGIQGHLFIKEIYVPDDEMKKIKMESKELEGRRRIYNHQFFGDYKVFYIGFNTWVLFVNKDGVKIVSPDHLENPISLDKGVYICKHPSPGEAID